MKILQLMARCVTGGVLLLTVGCTSTATGTAATGNPSGGSGGGDFCALIRAKGGADVLQIDDTSTGDVQTLLDNLDALTAAAPSDLKADFVVLDKAEHQMFDSGSPDPAAFARLRDPDVQAALHHITAYLTDECHIDPGS
jgi:hypothetical protein